jgi:hypothetical protein
MTTNNNWHVAPLGGLRPAHIVSGMAWLAVFIILLAWIFGPEALSGAKLLVGFVFSFLVALVSGALAQGR